MHSPDVCSFGDFFFVIYSKLNNLSGYLRPYFCLLRACWPYCPSVSTRWTCTTVLPTLRRRLVKRLERLGRTSLTSSMNCWVSDHEISMSAASGPLVLSHCATTGVIYEIYFLFSFIACTVIASASAWLQGEIFRSEGKYLYSSFRICFCLPLTKCQMLILSIAFSLVYWFVNTVEEEFLILGAFLVFCISSRSSFLVWKWLIIHTL